jgi:hypothetical protein
MYLPFSSGGFPLRRRASGQYGPGAWPVAAQIGGDRGSAHGELRIVNCALVSPDVGMGSKIDLRSRTKAHRKVGRISGVAMIGIACLLVAEQLLTIKQ